MKKALLYVIALFTLAFSFEVTAQQRIITGKVISEEDGQGLPGATVLVKGTTIGTNTNLDGEYSINVPEGSNVLVFSFVGLKTREETIGNRSIINVTLLIDASQLSEVVVTGYGTQERREITGSVSSISNEAIENLVTPSFESQLAGRAPGVQITTPSGILGARPIIRIRGVNSLSGGANPLFVIDGVPVVDNDRSSVNDSNPLANINPADIESFEVLKDGSATAIFGSRAANGVILITTKRGSTGKAKVSYNVSMGVNEEVNRFPVLNGNQFVTIANEKVTNAGGTGNAVQSDVDTNWQDYIFRNGLAQQHNLSVSGGSEATKYFFSIGFSEQESAIVANDLTRYSFRANIDHDISRRVRIGASTAYSYTEINGLNNGANSLSGAVYNATRNLPNVPIFDAENLAFDGFNVQPDGSTTGFAPNLVGPDNNIPNVAFALTNNIYRNRVHRINGNTFAELDIIEGLTARTQIGIDLTLNDDFQSLDPRHGDGRGSNGFVFMQMSPAFRWNWTNTLNYQKIVAEDHSFNVTLGTEYQYTNFYSFSSQGTDFSDRFYIERNLISGSYNNQFSGGGYSDVGFDSYFSRVNYSYKGKYLATLTARNDGMSQLPPDNKRGWFFGGSVGWRISDEAFFNSRVISDMKVRVSYAEVGNTEILGGLAFPYAGGFGPVLGGAGAGIGYSNVANNALGWERSAKFNVGLDMTVGPVTLMLDYFTNDVSDLVLSAPTAPSLGVPGNSISQNVGSLINRGFELRAMAKVMERGSFVWNTDFNFSYITNEVTNLVSPIIGTYNRTEEGRPMAELYGFTWMGVNSTNGNPLYLRNDDIIQYNLQQGDLGWRTFDPNNPGDVSVEAAGGPTQDFLGNTLPKWYGGWTNIFNYNNFDFEIFLRYSGGNFIMNESLRGLLGQGFSNNHTDILDRWTESGQNTNIPRLYSGQDQNMWQTSASNSRFIERGDFVRIQNIVLGYRIPPQWLDATFNGAISSARFFAQVQNPFIFTGYSGLDPELNQFQGQLSFGVDWNVAPIIRTWSLGLNVGF